MSGVAHVKSIFETYSTYTIDRTRGTPICVFRHGDSKPTTYAGGNGFAMSGGPALITHDALSLYKYLKYAEQLPGIRPQLLETWEDAYEDLMEAVSAKKTIPLQKLSA